MFALRRRALLGATLALGASLLGGCAVDPQIVSRLARPQGPALDFRFTLFGGEGRMDQVLEIYNSGESAVVPKLNLTALDADGMPLKSVVVYTVFGSDLGDLVIPPGHSHDVLRFSGTGLERLDDVQVTVYEFKEIDFPRVATDPYVIRLDASGRETPGADFRTLRVVNDNDAEVTVRLKYIVWNYPDDDYSQQAYLTHDVDSLLTIPATSSVEVKVVEGALPPGAEGDGENGPRPVSVQAYYAHSR